MLKKLALISLGATAVLLAADAWTKAPAEWTEKDVNQILEDSPWADRMAVETGQRGNIGNADDAKGMVQGNLTTPVIVMWRTALPIRQAMAKQAPAAANEAEPEVSVMLLTGIPGTFRQDVADMNKLTADTVLKVKGKADLHPTEIQIAGGAAPAAGPAGGKGKGGFGGGNFNLVVVFPKNAGLTADDKEAEFVTKVGKMNIRKKFKLKDMVYNGKLEM